MKPPHRNRGVPHGPGAAAKRHLERIERLAEKRIGEMLVDAGLIGEADLKEALNVQARHGGDTIKILISLGYIDADDFLDFLAQQPGIHSFDLSSCEIDPALVQLLPEDLVVRHEVFPIDRDPNHLTLGIVRPLAQDATHEIEAHTGLAVKTVLCSAEDVRASIERYYHGTLPSEPRVLTDEGLRALAPPLRLSTVAGLVRRLDSFPALPETVHRVHETMNDPNSSVRDVGEIVIMDPPIAAKVLSVANSAAYGFPQRIENISLAITLLGLRETYSIVLSAAVLNVFEKSKHFDYKRFWVEAMCCAAATRFVTKASGRRQLTGAFAAGLLHDIGRVALSEVVPQLYSKIDPGLKDDELLAIEKKTVGLSHTEAGHELALHWGLPHDIAESIRFHHEPAQATRAQELVATVSLADVLAHAAGSSLEDNENLFDGHQDALDILGLDIEIVEAMLDDFLSRRDESLRDAIN